MVVALLTVVSLGLVVKQILSDESTCDKFAAVNGSDDAAGTESNPFLTVQQLVDSLDPGQIGCLRAGTYDSETEIRISSGGTAEQRVVLRSAPNERATIKGRIWVQKGADYVTVRNLNLDGSPSKLPSPTINANNTRWINNTVTNRNTAICFSVGHPEWGAATGTLIRGNRIHRCGRLPRTNHDHGIYVNTARDTTIVDNYIHDNADRGIQLYPDAQRTLIKNNRIVRNGQGILFSGKGEKVSSGNVVRNNFIAHSKAGWNVFSNYNQTNLVGENNVVRDNCLKASHRDSYYNENGGVQSPQKGFSAYNNRVSTHCELAPREESKRPKIEDR